MLYVACEQKYFKEVLKFAFDVDKEGELLSYLARIGNMYRATKGEQYVCFLYKDFAPYSFTWSCYDLEDCEVVDGKICVKYGSREVCWLNGGLIYSGPLPNGDYNSNKSTFSVNLTEHQGWSLHT